MIGYFRLLFNRRIWNSGAVKVFFDNVLHCCTMRLCFHLGQFVLHSKYKVIFVDGKLVKNHFKYVLVE